MDKVVFCPALSALIIAGFVMLGGKSVVMVYPRGLGRSASEAVGGELVQLFHYPPRSARALLAGTLPFGIVATSVCTCCQSWLLLTPGLLRVVELRLLVGRFSGLVVLWTRKEKNTTKQKPPCTPRGFSYSISATGVEEIA